MFCPNNFIETMKLISISISITELCSAANCSERCFFFLLLFLHLIYVTFDCIIIEWDDDDFGVLMSYNVQYEWVCVYERVSVDMIIVVIPKKMTIFTAVANQHICHIYEYNNT